MEYIASVSIAIIIFLIILVGLINKVEVFTIFTEGAFEGLKTTVKIAPSIIGLVMMVTMLQESGLFSFLSELLNPLCKSVGFPSEVIPMALIRPISGSGALAVLDNILTQNGADTFVGRVASVMMGSTETTFYTIAMYFGSVNVSKTGCTVPCALLADLTGMVMSVVTVIIFFG
ncbi:MAG: spore maturation protein [Acutalibacteraceae bacterium]|nr:spore maturation protein [Acutalibacteraceae bacterium]